MASARLYNAVAKSLKGHAVMATEVGEDDVYEGIGIAARAIAQVFADDNPRFDRERFLSACGVPINA